MRPVGRVPSNFGENGDHVYSVPSNLRMWMNRDICRGASVLVEVHVSRHGKHVLARYDRRRVLTEQTTRLLELVHRDKTCAKKPVYDTHTHTHTRAHTHV